MGRRNKNLRLGQHLAISDISGFKFLSGEMRKLSGTQKGLLCHKSEWNPAHPQLELRSREDKQNVTAARPRQTDQFPTPPTQDEL